MFEQGIEQWMKTSPSLLYLTHYKSKNMNAGLIAGIVAAKRRRLINTFKELNATSSQSAVLPGEVGIRQGLIFRRLRNSGVLIEAGGGHYYLDEKAEQKLSKQRRKIAFIVLLIFLVVAVAFLIGYYA